MSGCSVSRWCISLNICTQRFPSVCRRVSRRTVNINLPFWSVCVALQPCACGRSWARGSSRFSGWRTKTWSTSWSRASGCPNPTTAPLLSTRSWPAAGPTTPERGPLSQSSWSRSGACLLNMTKQWLKMYTGRFSKAPAEVISPAASRSDQCSKWYSGLALFTFLSLAYQQFLHFS